MLVHDFIPFTYRWRGNVIGVSLSKPHISVMEVIRWSLCNLGTNSVHCIQCHTAVLSPDCSGAVWGWGYHSMYLYILLDVQFYMCINGSLNSSKNAFSGLHTFSIGRLTTRGCSMRLNHVTSSAGLPYFSCWTQLKVVRPMIRMHPVWMETVRTNAVFPSIALHAYVCLNNDRHYTISTLHATLT